MSRPNPTYPIVSADGHIEEPPELFERLSPESREKAERGTRRIDGGTVVDIFGFELFTPDRSRRPTDDEYMREFRRDPTGGRDLAVRRELQARDGVAGEVVFPNKLLALGNGLDAAFNLELAAPTTTSYTRSSRPCRSAT
jgi:hypothetical protein